MFRARLALALLGGFFLFGADRLLKYWSLTRWQAPHLFAGGWLGWQPFLNRGAAFGLPIPAYVLVALTIPIVATLVVLLVRAGREKNEFIFLALFFIIAGAASNLFDRLAYRETIDYLRVFTGVFNLADIGILLGGLLLVAGKRCQPTL